MNRLKQQIEAVLASLGTAEQRLEVAGNRWQANHDKAHEEHKKQKEAQHAATEAHKKGHDGKAAAENARARRCEHRAIMAHRRAEHFVGKAKDFAAEVQNLKETLATKEGKLHKLEREHGPRISPDNPNRVIDGTPKERLKFAAYYSDIHSSVYYSQVGREDIHHGLNGPPPGARYDCSSWFTSIYWSCGLPDPNGGDYTPGETMFTGSLGENGKRIAEHELDTGDAILYGHAPFHHVEMKIDPISVSVETEGHGTGDTNKGIVALLPGHREYRRFPKN
jgi:hypothetical protein